MVPYINRQVFAILICVSSCLLRLVSVCLMRMFINSQDVAVHFGYYPPIY